MRWDAKTWHGRAIRLPLRLVPRNAVVPVLSGPLRGLRWVAGSAPHGAWLGTLERRKLQAFSAMLTAGMVVWDLGANVGLYSLCASRKVEPNGKVYAFEPIAENIALLQRNLELNAADNVAIVQKAASDFDGVARMERGDSCSEWHIAPSGRQEVPTIRLDSWMRSESAPPPHILKIDVEGAESSVLLGSVATLRKEHPTIFLALHGETQRRECRELLCDLRYELRPVEAGQSIDTTDEWIAEFAS